MITVPGVTLYTFYNGVIKKFKGEVRYSPGSDTGTFKGIDRRVVCSSKTDVIFNSCFWTFEDSDEYARRKFVAYLYDKIAKLNLEVCNHYSSIANLLNPENSREGKFVETKETTNG